MGLYTKKLNDDKPSKEVKKTKGRPKKVKEEVKEEVLQEVELPEPEEPKQPEPEPPKKEEVEVKPPPVEEIKPPQKIESPQPPLKKDTLKKKVVKKVEKKTVAKNDDDLVQLVKKLISEAGKEHKNPKKENDFTKETALKMWNSRVKPNSMQEDKPKPPGYDKLYNQIFGR